MSKRASEIARPLPSGATTVRLNLSSVASTVGVSARERSADPEAEFVEAEVETARVRLGHRAAGELRHDLGLRAEVRGSDEESREAEAADLRLGQPDRLQDVVAEVDLLLG